MIDSNNPKIDVHELMEQVRLEVERCDQLKAPAVEKSRREYRKHLDRLERIEAVVDDARFQSQASMQWPAKLSRFPFSLSMKFQDFILRCFRFLFKKQTVINSDFVIALKELLRLLRDDQLEKSGLNHELDEQSLQLKELEERLWQLENHISETQQASNSYKQALVEKEQAIEAKQKALDEKEQAIESSLSALTQRTGDVEQNLLAIGQRLNLFLETEQTSLARVVSSEAKVTQVEQHLLAIGQRLHLALEAERAVLARIESAETKLAQTNERLSDQERKTLYLLDPAVALPEFLETKVTNSLEQALTLSSSLTQSDLSPNDSEQFYHVFENLFYNSVAVKAKQQYYVQFIDPILNAKHVFLDAGCGRGEFLENLKSSNIRAKGIDLNGFEVRSLQERNFMATQSDILEYLNGQTEKYSGISCLQVIEHLNFKYLRELLTVAHERIVIGGVIILETVNPHSLYALSNFYQDPTHINPLPPELVAFLLEWYGFHSVKIIYSSLLPEPLRLCNTDKMNYQDYAVIAYR